MKFAAKCLREGFSCLIFTPLIMIALIIAYKFGAVDQNTEVNGLILWFLEWRYSEETFSFSIIAGVLTTATMICLIKSQEIPRHEKIKVGKINKIAAKLICNTLMFFSGVFIANSIGSLILPFVPEIKLQEFMAICLIPCAIWIRYQATKINHWAIGHKI